MGLDENQKEVVTLTRCKIIYGSSITLNYLIILGYKNDVTSFY